MKNHPSMTGSVQVATRAKRCAATLLLSSCLAMALFPGCRPGTGGTDDAENFLVYNYDREEGGYRLSEEPIVTIQNIRQVSGSLVEMRGGGSLEAGVDNPQTREEWEQALIIADSQTPSIEYDIDEDGTVIPWDFDSAMLLTVYHHLEQSHNYFDAIDLGEELSDDLGMQIGDLVGRMPCYYYPRLELAGIPLPLFTDNAAYAYTLDAFLIPQRQVLVDDVPIFANRGVITHEYAHAVFNRVVYDDNRVPDFLIEEWGNDRQSLIALNELGGLDEGLADIWGALDTLDPNYIAASIEEELIDRDMAKVRFYEPCLEMAVIDGVYPNAEDCGGNYGGNIANPTDSEGVRFDYIAGGEYDSHHLGVVVGSIFWEMRAQQAGVISDADWERYLIGAMRAIKNPTVDFRLSMFFNALHEQLPAESRAQTCMIMQSRLLAIRDDLQCTTT